MTELAWMDATAQAELVKKRDVTPLELVRGAIERIERVNPKLNAVVTPMFDLAIEYAKGEVPDGPFRGVPFLLKDLLATSPRDAPLDGIFRAGAFASFTSLYNVTGQPAASIPLFATESGLPIGTQLVGRFGDEATLLRLSAQLEEAQPWAGRLPPVRA